MIEITKFEGNSKTRFINIIGKKVVTVYSDGHLGLDKYTKSPQEIAVSFKDLLNWLGEHEEVFFENILNLIRENE